MLGMKAVASGPTYFLGLSDCSAAQFSGIDALSKNPSLIAVDSGMSTQLSIATAKLCAGNTALTLREFREVVEEPKDQAYPAAPHLNDRQRDELLTKLSGGSVALDAEFQSLAFCTTVGQNIAVGFRQYSSVQLLSTLPTNLDDLFNGTVGTQELSVASARANVLAYSAMQLSSSFPLWVSSDDHTSRLMAGLSCKHIEGIAYASLAPESSLRMNNFVPAGWDSTTNCAVALDLAYNQAGVLGSAVSNSVIVSGAGSQNPGWGLDIGLSYSNETANSRSQYSLVITDIGFIRWTNGVKSSIHASDTIASAIGMSREYFERFPQQTVKEAFSSALPMRIQLSGAWSFSRIFSSSESILLGLGMQYGLNTEGTNVQSLQCNFGAELAQQTYRPSVQLGIRTGSYDQTCLSAGLGWRIASFLSTRIVTSNLESLVRPSQAQWLNIGWNWQLQW